MQRRIGGSHEPPIRVIQQPFLLCKLLELLKVGKIMKEIWKDIVGYEGLYQVSNLGRVKMMGRKKRMWHGAYTHIKPKILKQFVVRGYMKSKLRDINGLTKMISVHILVATAFIPNPNNYPCINHKDENKQNNNVENLEWCTHKYNSNYGTAIERCSIKRYKKVAQYTKDGVLIKSFESMTQAVSETNISFSLISMCCNGVIKTAKGYIFKFI